MDKRGRTEWKYKGMAINKIGNMFAQSLPRFPFSGTIIVPIPPSKVKTDPLYDDRIIQVMNIFCRDHQDADLREIISVQSNKVPSHEVRASPDGILPYLSVNKALCKNQKPAIVLVDDVLTSGAHFKACQTLLRQEFPKSIIRGLFIARAVH